MSAAVAPARRVRRVRTATRLKSPTTPLAHLGFEGARHEIPDRLPSARGERTTSIRVIEMNDDTSLNIKLMGETLKRLDLSKVGLKELDDDVIKRLPNLEKLDLSHNHLTEEGLPHSLSYLDNLLDIALDHNKITSIPRVVQRLKNLLRLKLTSNHLKNLDGVERLKKLTQLVLDNNEIDMVNKSMYTNLKRLEYFHCSRNKLRDVPADIKLWRHLKDLNLSNNELTSLPPEVFLLTRIDVLNASSNKISRLPSLTVKGKVKRVLSIVDLSDNHIVKFPGYLLMMTKKLDLSRNKIRTLPGGVIKKLDYATDQELCMDDNPITNPPRDVCECGIRSIIQYFQEVRAEMKIYQGIKVLVLGEQKAGKTSLVQTIVDGQSRLTEKGMQTVCMDMYEAEYDLDDEGPMGKKLHMALWDFGGQANYMLPHQMFLQQPSLTLIVFDMSTYKPEDFHNAIGRWIDWVIARKNKINMLLVGTHADRVRKARLATMSSEVSKAVESYLKRHVTVIQREQEKIKSLPNIYAALQEQLKAYNNLLKVETNQPMVVPVSSASMLGLGDLQQAIIELASDTKLFPHVLRPIPSLWIEVENYIEEKAWSESLPLVRWTDYVEDIVKKFGMKHLIEQITTYLHETGRVLWFSDHPQLKDYIILRPTWFCDLVKALFRQDISSMDFSHDDAYKTAGFNIARLEKSRVDFLEEGVIDKELLRALWSSLIPPDNRKALQEVVRIFVEFFQIGYPVDKMESSGRVSATSLQSDRSSALSHHTTLHSSLKQDKKSGRHQGASTPSENTHESFVAFAFSKILVPWLRSSPQPPTFRLEYERYVNSPSLVANFRFPRYIPPGLFETLTVRAQKEALGLSTLFHWKGGLYQQHEEHPVRFYLLRIYHEGDHSTCVRMEMRHEHPTKEDGDIETLWTVLLPFLRETDNLISQYQGVRVERHMECPKCHSLAFLGEWQTPKELQGSPARQCEICKAQIPTVFLIQPKEKKKVEEFLRKKIQEQKQRRQAAEIARIEAESAARAAAEKELKLIKEERLLQESHIEHGSILKGSSNLKDEVNAQESGSESLDRRSDVQNHIDNKGASSLDHENHVRWIQGVGKQNMEINSKPARDSVQGEEDKNDEKGEGGNGENKEGDVSENNGSKTPAEGADSNEVAL